MIAFMSGKLNFRLMYKMINFFFPKKKNHACNIPSKCDIKHLNNIYLGKNLIKFGDQRSETDLVTSNVK